ncbi:unnamed protein product [Linum trigynum]|uniref:Uncharacterized protein n=1 Tax=Linum trigynum TaxID=586398 RepID=A0AAV2E8G5_9ROSI
MKNGRRIANLNGIEVVIDDGKTSDPKFYFYHRPFPTLHLYHQGTSTAAKTSFSRRSVAVKAELNPSLVISLSTGQSLFLGRFVFFNFQRDNVAKQGLTE